jgi:prophage regulatory protein
MKNKKLAAIQETTGDRLMRLPELKKMTGLSAATLWRYEKAGLFPKRIRITTRCSVWKFSEVQAFIAKLSGDR